MVFRGQYLHFLLFHGVKTSSFPPRRMLLPQGELAWIPRSFPLKEGYVLDNKNAFNHYGELLPLCLEN